MKKITRKINNLYKNKGINKSKLSMKKGKVFVKFQSSKPVYDVCKDIIKESVERDQRLKN